MNSTSALAAKSLEATGLPCASVLKTTGENPCPLVTWLVAYSGLTSLEE